MIWFSIEVYSQENSKKVGLSIFSPYKSEIDTTIEEKIYNSLRTKLEKNGYQVAKMKKSSLKENLNSSKQNDFWIYVDGFYRRSENKNLELFIQIYNPQTGKVIDALNVTDLQVELEGIKLDPNEIRKKDEEVLEDAENKLGLRIRGNPKKLERRENIQAFILEHPIGKEKEFPIEKEDIQKETEQVFKLLAEEEVVTASRKSQKISEAPSKVLVFTQETIRERGYRTLTELLQDVPGFDFNSFYDSGEYPTDLILRGISDVGQTQILIMENGIIQNDIGNGWLRHVQFDTLLIDVERIEIILGPGSSLYGANAYAGLINIITKKGKSLFENSNKSTHTEIKLQGGKYKTALTEGLFAYKLPNDMIFQFAGRYYQTNGDRGEKRPDPGNYFNNNYEPLTVQTSEYGVIRNDRTIFGTPKPIPNGFDNSAKDFFVRASLSKNGFSIGFNLWDLREGLGTYVPAYEYFANTKGIPYLKHHRGFYVHSSYETEITQKLFSTTKIYYRNTTIMPDTGFVYTYRYQSIDNPVSNAGVPLPPVWDKAKQYHGPSSLVGAQQQFNYDIIDTNHLVFGFQFDRFTRQSISDGVGGVSLGKRQYTNSNIVESTWENQKKSIATVFYSNTFAGYIQDQQKLFNDKLLLTLGVRYDIDSDYGKVLTKRASIIIKPFSFLNTKLLYGEAFKAPTVFQLYDEFRGNRDLKPQTIKTYEIENGITLFKSLNLKLGYFMSQLRGLIAEGRNPDPNAPSTRTTIFQNFKPTHIYGFLGEIDFQIQRTFKFFGNYSVTRDRDIKTNFEFQADGNGRITNVTPIYDGKEIDNIAERKSNLGIHWNFWKTMHINLRLNWVGKRKAPTSNKYFQPLDLDFGNRRYRYQTEGKPDGYLSGYTIVNLTYTYGNMLGVNGLEFQIIVRNLLNKPFVGMGRQSGNAVRPIDEIQPQIRNPDGFVSPYHPQPIREIFVQVGYSF